MAHTGQRLLLQQSDSWSQPWLLTTHQRGGKTSRVGCPPSSWKASRTVGGTDMCHISQLQTDTCEGSGCKPFLSGKLVCRSHPRERFPSQDTRWTLWGVYELGLSDNAPRTSLKFISQRIKRLGSQHFCLCCVFNKRNNHTLS